MKARGFVSGVIYVYEANQSIRVELGPVPLDLVCSYLKSNNEGKKNLPYIYIGLKATVTSLQRHEVW